jgi:hypothetical protein
VRKSVKDDSLQVLIHLRPIGTTVNENLLHTGIRQELERVFDEWDIREWEKTLEVQQIR